MQKLYLSFPIKMEIMKCTVDNGKPKAFLFFSSQSLSVANHRLLLTGERLSIVFFKTSCKHITVLSFCPLYVLLSTYEELLVRNIKLAGNKTTHIVASRHCI